MRISRLTSVVSIAMATILAAGCSSSGSGSFGSSGSGGNVTLTWFMWSGSDVEKNGWLHIADMVTQKYPDIKIKFETTPFNDFWTKLTTQAASGNTACVIGLQGQRAPQFGNLLALPGFDQSRSPRRGTTTRAVSHGRYRDIWALNGEDAALIHASLVHIVGSARRREPAP